MFFVHLESHHYKFLQFSLLNRIGRIAVKKFHFVLLKLTGLLALVVNASLECLESSFCFILGGWRGFLSLTNAACGLASKYLVGSFLLGRVEDVFVDPEPFGFS